MNMMRTTWLICLAISASCLAQDGSERGRSEAAPTATPIEALQVAEGFHIELLYSVPKATQGSWVNLCFDPRGRLIVSDQYGSLYRVTPPRGADQPIRVEPIPVEIGGAQGLLWAFDSLYVVVNRGREYQGGVYRVRDADGDDQLDSLELLRKLEGRGEHGPHAVVLAPDERSLYIVCGDSTPLTPFDESRVPRIWDEDLLLPRTYGRGFMKGVRAPGGYVARIDPDGESWELVATGFRNQYDAAFHADGELFTFDADMEWDMNTPWYRPTRVCHVVSGAEFGWRNGGGKWPVEYPDSLPPVIDIGPGSPTGICFGYGAHFPAKYQKALFACDWSYGKMYAVHLEPRGASYTATAEEFLNGTPLPLTDVIVNPHDGAMYFTIGGRRVQSGLYRVRYVGAEPIAPVDAQETIGAPLRASRRALERLHAGDHPEAVETAWPFLGHDDRFLRFAARLAIEHRPRAQWQQRALDEMEPQASLTALLALARQFERVDKGLGTEIDTRPPEWAADRPPEVAAELRQLQQQMHASLERLAWSQLSPLQRVSLLRVYTLMFLRVGPPDPSMRQQLIERFDPVYPDTTRSVNSELAQLLVYLQAPSTAAKTVALLQHAPTQEEQIDYAKTLRHLRAGWTPELREVYFRWFAKARTYRGGASFSLFVEHIQQDAAALLNEPEKLRLAPILEAADTAAATLSAAEQRPLVKQWQLDELLPLIEHGMRNRDFEHGRQMFAEAKCFGCHRFDHQGGAMGPDLTALAGRFSPRDLLEAIVDPNQEISDQYAAVTVVTTDGRVVSGRIVNLSGDSLSINTDMLDPNAQVNLDRNTIEEMAPSRISMMPAGLLNTLNQQEVLDLMAYLLSGGNRHHAMFAKSGSN